MTHPGWTHASALAELGRLSASGVLGFYTDIEVTEIVAVPPGQTPVGMLALVVAEDRTGAPELKAGFLNTERVKLKTLPGWTFGVMRYVLPVSALPGILNDSVDKGSWSGSSHSLTFGPLIPRPPTFVPPDSVREVPLNKVLKNNFWNGSYVFEWSNNNKQTLAPLFDDARRVRELSEKISNYAPIGLASLSDRLGNVIVQLPVTVLMVKFHKLTQTGSFSVDLAWHPNATPRPVRAACEMRHDGVITAYGSSLLQAGQTPLPMTPVGGTFQGIVWDDTHNVIVAATGQSAFIESINLNIRTLPSEPRLFTIPDKNGSATQQRVGVSGGSVTSTVGTPREQSENWTDRRMYREELSRLAADRRFVQYRPDTANAAAERARALADIRFLLQKHGEAAAWLWDPYLSGRDLLETLFFCSHSGTELRALTDAEPIPGSAVSRATFVAEQKSVLDANKGNLQGLRLEYRARVGAVGWGFHDRFLIFPKAERGALAWSLGTSVNSLGTQHHILQQVGDGQLVMDAFADLWDQLTKPEHLVWKAP